MKIQTFLYVVISGILLGQGIYFFQHQHRAQRLVLGMLGGIVSLGGASVVLTMLGISLSINFFTGLVALGLGFPGVIGLVLCSIIL